MKQPHTHTHTHTHTHAHTGMDTPTNFPRYLFSFCNCSSPKTNLILIDASSLVQDQTPANRTKKNFFQNKNSFQTRNRRVCFTPESEFAPPVRSCTAERDNDPSSQRDVESGRWRTEVLMECETWVPIILLASLDWSISLSFDYVTIPDVLPVNPLLI